MAASREEISGWFNEARESNATHLLIICDTWDFEDFPRSVSASESVQAVYAHYQQAEGYRVMEVYDLSLPKEPQMAEHRASHLGQESKP